MSRILRLAALCSLSTIAHAQPDWTRLAGPTAPPGRLSDVAATFDDARGVLVMSGGWNGSADLDETWEWDGTSWTQRSPAITPGKHSSHRLAYDAARGRTVLFGGYDGGTARATTWEWDGTTWHDMQPATSPSPRFSYAMCYDAGRQRTVLFGGSKQGGARLGDTWMGRRRLGETHANATPIPSLLVRDGLRRSPTARRPVRRQHDIRSRARHLELGRLLVAGAHSRHATRRQIDPRDDLRTPCASASCSSAASERPVAT